MPDSIFSVFVMHVMTNNQVIKICVRPKTQKKYIHIASTKNLYCNSHRIRSRYPMNIPYPNSLTFWKIRFVVCGVCVSVFDVFLNDIFNRNSVVRMPIY